MQRYLDYNATAPVIDESLTAFTDAARTASGNPSSLHWAGRAARKLLDDGRDALARQLNVESGSVVFTSGGTEANNMAIHGWLSKQQPGKIVVSAIEHPSVLQPLASWAAKPGWEVVHVRPNRNGAIDAETFCSHIDAETRLACLMLVNNETGAIQPVESVVPHCRAFEVPTLVDAVQALGKLPLDLSKLEADFVSFSAHKIGGPKGVGALTVRRGRKLEPLLQGGGQERKRRSGTENVPGVAGFAAALGMLDFDSSAAVRNGFEDALAKALPEVIFFARDADRVGNTSMFSMPGLDGETLLMQLDLAGFAVASGSACSSGKRNASHVLSAMGVSDLQARSSVRVSFGPGHGSGDADALVDALVTIRKRLKMMAGET
ncbi:MAG: cysteine desulfurase family protein [Mariprofundaceae bacterium]|nr:cysteine desulfurase family protein [Mariprofundaceae bacterium]